jgi:hypothetical protein
VADLVTAESCMQENIWEKGVREFISYMYGAVLCLWRLASSGIELPSWFRCFQLFSHDRLRFYIRWKE